MRTLIYVKVAEQTKAAERLAALRGGKDTASIRVIEFWQGETERCDVVITDNEAVAKAYAGITVKPFTEVKKVEKPVEVVETPVETVEVSEEPKRMGRPRKITE